MTSSNNIFLQQLNKSTPENTPKSEQGSSSNNVFLKQLEGKQLPEEKDSFWKSLGRYAYQLPAAAAQKYTWPLNLIQILGEGGAVADYDEFQENLPRIKKLFPHSDWGKLENLSKEDYIKAVQTASEAFPTQQNVERIIEEKTGAPLTPKTTGQKLVRLGGTAATFRPGGVAQKATAGVVAPAASAGLEALGVPEPLAELGGLVAGGAAPAPSFGKATKPSGLTTRRFENVKKPTAVSAARHEIIKESVEGDFKKIADQLLEKKSKTYSAMKEDNLFKEKIGDLFGEVEDLAKDIKGSIHTQDLKDAFRKRFHSRETTGITPDEFERAYRKEVRQIMKEIPYDDLNALQSVQQFRKNNKSLKELYEPGKSSAANRAKKEALLEYNRAIEDVVENKFPETKFKDLFKFTNKRWQEINDLEQIDTFVKDLSDGKINYGKAKQIFSKGKEHVQRPFKRILGEEGFKDFKTLTEDLLSTEKSMGYIKKAKDAGFDELAKTAGLYLLNKKVGAARTLSKTAKSLYQMLLDKPKLTVTWKNAYSNLKNGNYKEAQKYFTVLNEELSKTDRTSNQKSQQ